MNYAIVDLEQKSDKWKEWRSNYIGASDAPVIQEVSPWKTLLELWEEKVEGKEVATNAAMQRGNDLEEQVRQKVSEEQFSPYKPVCMQSTQNEWMIASLDGWDAYGEFPIIEIKCPGEEGHSMAIKGEIPAHYFPQLQHQMVVADVDMCLYVSYNAAFGENSLIQLPVRREKEYCKYMVEREYRFYESIINFDPPKPTDKDIVRINDSGALSAASEYMLISKQMKHLEEVEKELRKTLISYASHPRAVIGNLKVSRIIRQGNIQYGKIPELKAVDLNQYRGSPIESWRITQ